MSYIDFSSINRVSSSNKLSYIRISEVFSNYNFNICDGNLSFQHKRNLEQFKLSISRSLDYLKSTIEDYQFVNRHFSRLINELSGLSLSELNQLYAWVENEVKSIETKSTLKFLINKIIKSRWLEKFILKIEKSIILIIQLAAKLIINRRSIYRKILSFHFKNLDDYHDDIILNKKLFVVEYQLPVLIFNNYINEKTYTKKNR